MKFFRNTKGFTLVELLIVIIIIAVLAGVVLITLNPAEQRARAALTTVKSNTAAICRAQALCMVENNEDECVAFAADAVEIADPDGNPTGSTYDIAAASPYTVTGQLLDVNGVDFTFTCNNVDPATKGQVFCTPVGDEATTYSCVGMGLAD